jgi:hypothetical protein
MRYASVRRSVTRRRGALQRVRAGDEAEFAFYAVPGLVYKGRVKSRRERPRRDVQRCR